MVMEFRKIEISQVDWNLKVKIERSDQGKVDRELENVPCMNSVCVLCYSYIIMTYLKVACLKRYPVLPKFPEIIWKGESKAFFEPSLGRVGVEDAE